MSCSVLETPRLLLRPFAPSDADALFSLLSDPEVNRFLPWFPVASRAEVAAFAAARLLGRPYHYAICRKPDDAPIGYIQVSAGDSHDLGYAIRREFWRQGLVSEAAGALLVPLRQAGIPFLTATHDRLNPASGGVMRRLGMRYAYSYLEQWQPKDIPVVFRLYQLNLADPDAPTYRRYWEASPWHFVETGL